MGNQQSQTENLFQACREGDLKKVKLLVTGDSGDLEPGPGNKADISAEDNRALWEASSNGQLEIVKFLLENKADITANNNWAVQVAAQNGHLEIVKFLLENKADITTRNNFAIKAACGIGHLETAKFLVENKADIAAGDNWAIQNACEYGHLEIVKFLVENKADITAENNRAIRLARKNNRFEVVKYLESLCNPPPLSNQALIKAKEKYSPTKLIFESLEKNLESIVENLCRNKPYNCYLTVSSDIPREEVVNIVVSWFKEKGLENAENRVSVISKIRHGTDIRYLIDIPRNN